MFNKERLKEILPEYKTFLVSSTWRNPNWKIGEIYKWKAVKTFQDNWKVDADDFPGMLTKALSKTENLLASKGNYPRDTIIQLAQKTPEEVRAMFIALFDESKDIIGRIHDFKVQADVINEKHGEEGKQHYQSENAISTYLWLKYPEKYYIYKFGEIQDVAKKLEASYTFKRGAVTDNLRNFYLFYDEICSYISEDDELTNLLKKLLAENDECDSDIKYKTLTIDVGFYISRRYEIKDEEKEEWFPSDYSPEISTEEWIDLINDPDVFNTGSLEIMKRLKDYGGQATCSQLATRYGETKNFYNSGSVALARRVQKATGCSINTEDNENSIWWPILYIGKPAEKGDEGSYIWKLRKELSNALDEVDLSEIRLYAEDQENSDCRYWWLNANPKIWSFSNLAINEEESYTLLNDNGNKRRIYQNFLDARPGDMVIGYEAYPIKQIVAICMMTAGQDGEKILFTKKEGLANPIDLSTIKSIPELDKMEFFVNPNGSLFKLTKGEYELIMDVIRDANPLPAQTEIPKYTKENFLDEVFMSEPQYDMLVEVLKNKKNIILKGAPGVGKTYAARRLAYSIMGEEDDSRIEFVQFHQNYSYEDFIMGYKPAEDGFELKTGIFYQFCLKAANQPQKDFFFIIDEINRGNMSKILGELLMLIENDYRGKKVTLAYNGLPFSVPENLYIIGMMNTADRSIAMIDYALRRRFSFFDIEPGFDSEGFIKYQNSLNNETFNQLIATIKDLNHAIADDPSLGKGYCIGHSYFSNWTECTDEKMRAVVDYDIIPMLEEYWFDSDKDLQTWSNRLHEVF